MAFTPFGFDVNVHTKLGDDPNVDNNMTADQLKALFDSPMVAFKQYINDVLIPALDSFSPDSSVAVFIQEEKPQYSPCFWFRPLNGGLSEMNYINNRGETVKINVKASVDADGISPNSVSSEKIRSKAVTPDKLDREYYEKAHPIVLQEGVHYGSALPAAGTKGRLFFKKVT